MQDTFTADEGLKQQQRRANTFKQWREASEQLDYINGYDKWKNQDESSIYDYKLIKHRTEEFYQCRQSGDLSRLLFMIRTQFERNLGNMGILDFIIILIQEPKNHRRLHFGM